jgi:hypothetical protein
MQLGHGGEMEQILQVAPPIPNTWPSNNKSCIQDACLLLPY